jgi:hypothetical protein
MVGLPPGPFPAEVRPTCAVRTIATEDHGYFLESHPKLKPLMPLRRIYLCGGGEGLRISRRGSQGQWCVLAGDARLSHDKWAIDPIVAKLARPLCDGTGEEVRSLRERLPLRRDRGEPASRPTSFRQVPRCGTCVPNVRTRITQRTSPTAGHGADSRDVADTPRARSSPSLRW